MFLVEGDAVATECRRKFLGLTTSAARPETSGRSADELCRVSPHDRNYLPTLETSKEWTCGTEMVGGFGSERNVDPTLPESRKSGRTRHLCDGSGGDSFGGNVVGDEIAHRDDVVGIRLGGLDIIDGIGVPPGPHSVR